MLKCDKSHIIKIFVVLIFVLIFIFIIVINKTESGVIVLKSGEEVSGTIIKKT